MDAAPPNHGGGGVKKKRRKRGGAGPQQTSVNNAKDTNGGGGGGGGPTTAAGRGGGKGGNKKRRGGGGGGGGGRVGGESSRFGRNACSPLQLPHVKVTVRNIRGANRHGSIEGVVDSVRSFLEGAFPAVAGVVGDDESNPYMVAWHMEREEFESVKNMFAEAASSGENGGAAYPSGRAFSSGWVYEEKPFALPSDRLLLLPSSEVIAMDLTNNITEKKVTKYSGATFIVDSAMSQMMQECGKKYLSFVGGQFFFDEESAMDVVLAERVKAEKKKLAEEQKDEDSVEVVNGASDQPSNANENVMTDKKVETISVEAVTKGVEKLSTSDKPTAKQQVLNQMPLIRVRILSATPVKMSKRRGEIAGKVQLAMYPPDPCLLFQGTCRDAGKIAAENHLENTAKVASKSVKGEYVSNKDGTEKEIVSPDDKDNAEVNKQADVKDAETKPPTPANKVTVPQIPYFPLLSPAERSRAVARSRVLLHRSVEAMKLHAAAQSRHSCDGEANTWEVVESPSQKTWKGRPNPMVGSMMAGMPLRELVVEHESAKSTGGSAATKKGRGRGFYGDSRADRYDSTIENSEDYKAFMESLKDGTAPPKEAPNADVAAKKSGDPKPAETDRKPPAVDEEGRPLSAIVMHLREKQAESAKAKAEAAAAVAKARAAAAAAKEKIRKEKLKMKKEATKKRKKDAARSKKSSVRASSSRPVSGGGNNNKGAPMPPPGAMLLKKGGAGSIPPSGFGVP